MSSMTDSRNHDDLPRVIIASSLSLPGGTRGYPRVFWDLPGFVAHTDSRFDLRLYGGLCARINASNRSRLERLWAVAITVRIVLVEIAALRPASREEPRRPPASRRSRLTDFSELASVKLNTRCSSPAFRGMFLPTAFAVQLVNACGDQDPAVTPALRWLE